MKRLGLKNALTAWSTALALPLALTVAVGLQAQDPGAPPPPDNYQAQQQAQAPDQQNQQYPDQQAQPPDQSNVPPVTSDQPANEGVARVSVVDGQVTMQRGDADQWQAATVNLPLMNGDKIATAGGSRAEIQLDYANILRLSENAQANLVTLGNGQIQLQLASGTADFVVLRSGGATAEIDTPNMAVHPQGPGVYRIQVGSDSNTQVAVRNGTADISTPQGSVTVNQGQMIQVQGTDAPQYQVVDAPAEDAWDQWNHSRDNTIEQAKSWNDTNPRYTGTADLDNYGHWTTVPGYGNVWVPNDQSDDWAPYSDGNWLWEDYWGWTWVSAEPWGWAPYHYGRWFVYDSAWCWWPGPVTPFYNPIWAPAYVSFFGWGGGFGFGWGAGFGAGYGFGRIGWLAIGPGDVFRPWWGAGIGYNHVPLGELAGLHGREMGPLGSLGRGGIGSNLGRMYSDARVRGGISAMGADRFGQARVDGHANIGVSELRQAQGIGGRVPVVPTRASLRVSDRAVSGPSRAGATHFFGATRDATGVRTGFGAQQEQVSRSLARSSGFASADSRGAASGNWQRFSNSASPRSDAGAGSRSSSGANGNWRSFSGSSANRSSSAGARGQSESRGASGNWQRFTPNSGASRGGEGGRSSSRPPLSVHQPIVTPRAQSSSRMQSRGGGRNFSSIEGGRDYSGGDNRSFGGGSSRSYGGGGGSRSFGGGHSFGGGGHSGGGGHGGGHGR